MKNSNPGSLPRWLFVFGLCFALFHILPAFLNVEIKHRFMVADLFDLFTPYVVLFIIYKIWRKIEKENPETKFRIKLLLIFGGITFIEGHGMHLSANAIHRHVAADNSSLYVLTYFFDETLGHILWDSGTVLMVISLFTAGLNERLPIEKTDWPLLIIGAICFGFTYFVNAVEGQTVFFTLPFAVAFLTALLSIFKKKKISPGKNSVLTFFLISYLSALLFFLIWLIWQGGFPEFSEIGWI